MSLNRTPTIDVRRFLRGEVGFGCPIEDCDSPYLEWHHFDPPWSERQHHDTSGMIALCSLHHRKADAGAFTKEQLHELKRNPPKKLVQGRFDWMRRKLLAVAGGSFYYETLNILSMGGESVIHLHRDPEQHLLLNVRLPAGPHRRLELSDNDWIAHGDLEDLECPPSGRLLQARYPNGDRVRVEFQEIDDAATLEREFSFVNRDAWESVIEFPITVVVVEVEMPDRRLKFNASAGAVGIVLLSGCFFGHAQAALWL